MKKKKYITKGALKEKMMEPEPGRFNPLLYILPRLGYLLDELEAGLYRYGMPNNSARTL